jgi:hypothetical protein
LSLTSPRRYAPAILGTEATGVWEFVTL